MIFENREHAGRLLAVELSKLKLDKKSAVIAAIPRGGVAVGVVIAKELALPLTALVVKKLGAPTNPELAIGAIGSFGTPVLDRWLIAELGIRRDWLKREIRTKKREAAAREKFLGVTPSEDLFGDKVVIVVDDGLATGQTAKAAAKILRQLAASKLILAVPCAAPVTLDKLADNFDEIICLERDPSLEAVGQFYHDFRPVEDEEVKDILVQSSRQKGGQAKLKVQN